MRSRIPLYIGAATLMLAGALPARAQTCTTWVNATDGDDGNSGTQIQPLRSLEYTYQNRPSGETVCVAGGEYFYGMDADGVAFSGSKDMTFVLNAFAGADEVRISEKLFRIDAGSGTIAFTSGTAGRLVLGTGVLNRDAPSQPDLLNFVHTLDMASGSLDVRDIDFVIESSVGNPGFEHPDNPAKSPPASAAIVLGNAAVEGNLDFQPASRTFRYTGSANRQQLPGTPVDLAGQRLVFEHSGTLIWTGEADLGEAELELRHEGVLIFREPVSLDLGSTIIVTSASKPGDLTFESDLVLFDSGIDTGIDPALGGGGDITIKRLVATGDGGGTSVLDFSILNSGKLSIQAFAADGSAAPTLRLDLLPGSIELGSPGDTQSLIGPMILRSPTSLAGSIRIPGFGSEPALTNESTISTGAFHLATGPDTPQIRNLGTIDPGTSFALGVESDARLEGSGSSGYTLVSAGTLTVAGHALSGPLESTGTGGVRFEGTSSVAGFAQLNGTGGVDVEMNASVRFNAPFSANNGPWTQIGEVVASGDVTFGADLGPINAGDDAVIKCAGTTQFFSLGVAGFPVPLRVLGADLTIISDHAIPQTTVESGTVTAVHATTLTFSGPLVVLPDGSADLRAPEVDFEKGWSVSGGSLSVSAGSRIRAAGRVALADASLVLDTPVLGPLAGGTLTFAVDTSQDLPALDLSTGGNLTIESGEIRPKGDLDLMSGEIIIDEGAVLALSGNLTRTGGVFEPVDGGWVKLESSSTQTISGFMGSVLPALRLRGADIVFPEDLTVIGAVAQETGASTLEGSTLTVSGNFSMTGGAFQATGSGGGLWVGGNLDANQGLLRVAGSLTLSGNLEGAADFLDMEQTRLRLRGANQTISISRGLNTDTALPVMSLRLEPGTSALLEGAADIEVSDDVTISTDAVLQIESGLLRMTGGTADPVLSVSGQLSGSERFLVTGPTLTLPRIAGAGLFGGLVVDLDRSGDDLTVQTGSDVFRVGGLVRFESGGIDLNGRSLEFEETNVFPGITINLTSVPDNPVAARGKGFSDSADGMVAVTAGSYDLTYTGSASALYETGAEFRDDRVRNLSIEAEDEVNNPPVFGVRLTAPAHITGALSIRNRSLLRVSGDTLSLLGEGVTHSIEGTVAGSGALRLGAPGTQLLGDPVGASRIQRLVVDPRDDSSPVTVSDLRSAESLDIRSGDARFSGGMTSISSSVHVSGGSVGLSTHWDIGAAGSSADLSVSDATFLFQKGSGITMTSAATVSFSATASTGIDDFLGALDPEFDGFVSLTENTSMNAPAGIPRLRLEANAQSSSGDDLVFNDDIFVTDAFEHVNGDLFLGPFDLILTGSSFRFDTDASPFDGGKDLVFGELTESPGSIVFEGPTNTFLGSDMEIQAASMTINPGIGTVILHSLSEEAPSRIVLTSGRLTLSSGTLDLGFSDIVLNGSTPEVLRLIGGELAADADPTAPPSLMPALRDGGFFPLDDDQFGEIVLGGSGNASIRVSDSRIIPNLRIEGSVRIDAASGPVTVSDRLVFGQKGASFQYAASSDLALSGGITVIRRGSGSLSNVPLFLGTARVFYDLDDGSTSGTDTDFAGGALTTGAELPAVVDQLGVLAGNRAGAVNRVRLGKDVQVTGSALILSGVLDAGDHLDLSDADLLAVDQADASAPGSILQSSTIAAGPGLDLYLTARSSRVDVGSIQLSSGNDFDDFRLHLAGPMGGSPAIARLLGDLRVGSLTLSGEQEKGSFRLDGHGVQVDGPAVIENATLTSTQVAELLVHGPLQVHTDGSLEGNIVATSAGPLEITGAFSAIELVVFDDFLIAPGGILSPSSRLVFKGNSQSFALAGDIEIGSLILDQETAGSRVRVSDSGSSMSLRLRIREAIELKTGILDLDYHKLVLPGKSGGFVRTADRGPSHVQGTIVRTVTADETGEYVFPVGGETAYRPLSIAFDTPAISTTELSVTHSESEIQSRQGLPLSTPDGLNLTDTSPYGWNVVSSVDFAQSQPVTVAATIEQALVLAPQQHRLISRRNSVAASSWKPLNGTASIASTPLGYSVKSSSATGILAPGGTQISAGIPRTPDNAQTRLQFVNLSAIKVLSFRIGGLSHSLAPASASAEFPVSYEGGQPASVELFDADSGARLEAMDVELDPDGRNVLAAVSQFGQAEPNLYPLSLEDELNPDPSLAYLAFGHLARSLASISVSAFGSAPGSLLNLVDGDVSEPFGFDQDPIQVDARVGPAGRPLETFALASAPLAGTTSFAAFVDGAPFGRPEGTVSLLVVPPTGEIQLASIVTGNDPEPGQELPSTFRLTGNFPNPFSRSTTLTMDVPESARVHVTVVDMLGRIVDRMDAGLIERGGGVEIRLDGSRWASGMYVYRIEAQGVTATWTDSGTMVRVR